MLGIQAVGDISAAYQGLVKKTFLNNELVVEFKQISQLVDSHVISFDKQSSIELIRKNIKFYNWDLLFAVLGPNDSEGEIEIKLNERIKILKAVIRIKFRVIGDEFHGSIRVHDLEKSSGFYT